MHIERLKLGTIFEDGGAARLLPHISAPRLFHPLVLLIRDAGRLRQDQGTGEFDGVLPLLRPPGGCAALLFEDGGERLEWRDATLVVPCPPGVIGAHGFSDIDETFTRPHPEGGEPSKEVRLDVDQPSRDAHQVTIDEEDHPPVVKHKVDDDVEDEPRRGHESLTVLERLFGVV